jgi:hypothetical protein
VTHDWSRNANSLFYWWTRTRPISLKRPAIVFTRQIEGIFNVLSDLRRNSRQDKELIKSPATTASGNEDGGTATATEIRGKAEEPKAPECIEPKTVHDGTQSDTLSTAED